MIPRAISEACRETLRGSKVRGRGLDKNREGGEANEGGGATGIMLGTLRVHDPLNPLWLVVETIH